jgi:predicted nucleic acid-binding protein
MSYFYFDSSALVKRYLTELGSIWVLALTDPAAGHMLISAEITRVEMAAAFASRHRAPGGISQKERDDAVDLLLKHCDTEYQITSLSPASISRAVSLTQNHPLRGYDAVQLATALAANDVLLAAGLPGLTFVAADHDLITAAQHEGLPIENPNHHP